MTSKRSKPEEEEEVADSDAKILSSNRKKRDAELILSMPLWKSINRDLLPLIAKHLDVSKTNYLLDRTLQANEKLDPEILGAVHAKMQSCVASDPSSILCVLQGHELCAASCASSAPATTSCFQRFFLTWNALTGSGAHYAVLPDQWNRNLFSDRFLNQILREEIRNSVMANRFFHYTILEGDLDFIKRLHLEFGFTYRYTELMLAVAYGKEEIVQYLADCHSGTVFMNSDLMRRFYFDNHQYRIVQHVVDPTDIISIAIACTGFGYPEDLEQTCKIEMIDLLRNIIPKCDDYDTDDPRSATTRLSIRQFQTAMCNGHFELCNHYAKKDHPELPPDLITPFVYHPTKRYPVIDEETRKVIICEEGTWRFESIKITVAFLFNGSINDLLTSLVCTGICNDENSVVIDENRLALFQEICDTSNWRDLYLSSQINQIFKRFPSPKQQVKLKKFVLDCWINRNMQAYAIENRVDILTEPLINNVQNGYGIEFFAYILTSINYPWSILHLFALTQRLVSAVSENISIGSNACSYLDEAEKLVNNIIIRVRM